jgi:hypothetical protein
LSFNEPKTLTSGLSYEVISNKNNNIDFPFSYQNTHDMKDEEENEENLNRKENNGNQIKSSLSPKEENLNDIVNVNKSNKNESDEETIKAKKLKKK